VPFVGVYAAATTKSGFHVDGMFRAQYYQTALNAPNTNLFNQNIDAQGYSFSSSMSYSLDLPRSNWYIEPSAGFVISKVKVDPFDFVTAGAAGILNGSSTQRIDDRLSGTLNLNTVNSNVGHAGIQFGNTIQGGNVIWQPFAALSVWHEFGPDLTSSYLTCPFCVVNGGHFITISSNSSTSTFGTFGQYSAGVFVALDQTGWTGFARVDYRDGANLQGLNGIGGIRYQFRPEMVTQNVKLVKAPRSKVTEHGAVDWTGFFIGGFGGGTLGGADWDYPSNQATPKIGGYHFGAEVGYNYQIGRWVFGGEADLQKTNLNGGTACGPLLVTPTSPTSSVLGPMFQLTCNASAEWINTVSGRVGYSWDRALFFGKVGGAWTDEYLSATCNTASVAPPALLCASATAPANGGFTPSSGLTGSTHPLGWIVGFGAEFAFTPNWSGRAEIDYISFGDRSIVASDGTPLTVDMHVLEAKIGLNYRFDLRQWFSK
jgi:opacity protein-like surface antigen